MTEDNLKPCPFCGKEVYIDTVLILGTDCVKCDNCTQITTFFRNYGDTEKNLIERWNMRND
jgi:hypothetical protein